MTDKDLYDKAMGLGWDIDQVIIFREEALEGWVWCSPDGDEFYSVGDWSEEPTAPLEVMTYLGN